MLKHSSIYNMTITPFLIGLAGSLHCIGMCGPLASLATGTGRNSLVMRLLYNGGRIVTYGLMGALLTFLGSVSGLWGIQTSTSLIVGGLLLTIGFTGLQIRTPAFLATFLTPLTVFLKKRFSVLLAKRTPVGVLAMGMINGLLPCGMTWAALVYCATLQWPFDGFIAMVVFGVGTLPAMIGFPAIMNKLVQRFKFTFKTVQTILLILSGCILIVRTLIHDPSFQSNADGGIVVCGSHKIEQP